MTTSTIEDFLIAIHPPDAGVTELRALPSERRTFINATDADAIERFLRAHANENVYVGVATRKDASSGALEHCAELHALFADIDFKTTPEADTQARLKGFPLKPSIIVRSGNGLHLYWRLREPMDLQTDAARAKDLLRRLALALGGDLNAAEPARILRVPGTLNHKYSPAGHVVIERFDSGMRYNPCDFDDFLPEEPAANGNGTGRFEMPPRVREGERNATLYRLARSLKARQMGFPAILAALRAENEARCQPPLPDEEIGRIARHAYEQADQDEFRGRQHSQTRESDEEPHTVSEPVERLLAELDETLDYLVEPLWLADAVGFIAGEPKALKTWIALAIAWSLVTGKSFAEHFGIPKPRGGPLRRRGRPQAAHTGTAQSAVSRCRRHARGAFACRNEDGLAARYACWSTVSDRRGASGWR